MRGKSPRKLDRVTAFDVVNFILIGLCCLIFLYPVLLTVSISFSDPNSGQRIVLMPVGFNTDSYMFILSNAKIWQYYANSILYSVTGTVLSLLLTSLMAYPFIIPGFRGKTFLNIYMVITMFFSGGLIPYYFVIRALGMIDTPWVMIIPGAISAYTVVIFRTFFSSIPEGLRESAHIDGAGHLRTLFQIVLPVSKPLLATFALMGLVSRWNDFFTALQFLRSDALMPMQMFLRRLLVLMDFREGANVDMQLLYSSVTSRSMRSAAVVVTILPILCVYPFLQKYFTKGMMVGSLKS